MKGNLCTEVTFELDFSFGAILGAIAIAWAISLDAFVCSFAYGSKGIKIPIKSAWIINLICSGVIGLALFAGSIIRQYIPYGFAEAISFAILFILGIAKLLDSITISIIRKHSAINKEIKFSLLNFKFILNLYANPEQADIDGSKILSMPEAVSLALALSLDGLAVGLGAAIGNANILIVFISTLIADMIALLAGAFLGNKAGKKIPFNLSWLCGALLISLAFSQFL